MNTVWLRNVGDDEDDCWIACNKVDPGATPFIPGLSRDQIAKIAAEVWLGTAENVPAEWHDTGLKFADRFMALATKKTAQPQGTK